jgi:FMN phosphatase YigB (HAD superfamily)/predicted ATP-grasp superfamily ATP-dependent carboligase
LIVSGGSFPGLTLIKGLRQSGAVRLLLADCYEQTVSRYFVDRSFVVAKIADTAQFVDDLLSICREEKVDLLIPATDLELLPLAQNVPRFQAVGAAVAISDLDLLETLLDKRRLHRFLAQAGLPVLPDLDIHTDRLEFPLLGKPRVGGGSKGIIVAHSREALAKWPLAELAGNFVWQPFLTDFKEYSIDFAIDFNGAASSFVVRERLRTAVGFAVVVASVEQTAIVSVMEELISLIRRCGGRGIFNVQFLHDPAYLVISDVNPRVGTSAVFAQGFGINLPIFICRSLGAANITPAAKLAPHARPLTMVRYLEEIWIQNEALSNVKGIVCDLDDTLINHKAWILAKLEMLFPQFALQLPARQEFLTAAVQTIEEGNRSTVFDVLRAKFGLSADLTRQLIHTYRECLPDRCLIYKDVEPTLAELKRLAYRLALITDNPPQSQRQKLAVCALEHWFEQIVYTRELGAEKPARAGFAAVANGLGLAPNQLVMVGDNLYRDIEGALNAGYQHGFLVTRPGSFFSFDLDVFRSVRGQDNHVTTLKGLGGLLWYLQKIG